MLRNPHRGLPDAALALSWLNTDQHGASVLATAHNMLSAETQLRHALPSNLGPVCKVARIEGQRITVAVPSAAYASKLRQLGPSILKRLNGSGWNLSEITVRVQGILQHSLTNTSLSQRQVEPLGPTALQAFDALHADLRPGPLSEAIARLLAHHQHPGRQADHPHGSQDNDLRQTSIRN